MPGHCCSDRQWCLIEHPWVFKSREFSWTSRFNPLGLEQGSVVATSEQMKEL